MSFMYTSYQTPESRQSMSETSYTSRRTMAKVRAHFIGRQTSLRAWARAWGKAHGHRESAAYMTAHKVLRRWSGRDGFPHPQTLGGRVWSALAHEVGPEILPPLPSSCAPEHHDA